MTKLTLKLEGAEIVRKGLENLSAEVPKVSRRRIYNTMLKIRTRMKKYPPPRRGQRYIRTFRLQRGWNIKQANNGYSINNATAYTKFVVGDAFGTSQAWMHISTDQGPRWPLMRNVFDEEIKKLPAEIEDDIKVVSRRGGLR
jgi:hypothetical protein